MDKFIEIVKTYPILYDFSHKDYKNKFKKDKIWDEIGHKINENGDILRKKWRNLRDSHAKYIKSEKTGQATGLKKKWIWAEQMDFLKQFLASDPTSSNGTSLEIFQDEKNYLEPDVTSKIIDQSVVIFEVLNPDWTREAIVLLIKTFKAHTVLYDYENKLYHHKHTRNKALNSIVKTLKTIRPGTTIDHIKMKIGSIRSQYVGEIKKLSKSIAKNLKNSAEEIYTPTVWWFNHMTFLLKFLKMEPNTDNKEEILKIIENRIKNRNKFVDENIINFEANEHKCNPEVVYLKCITPTPINNLKLKGEKDDILFESSSDLTNDSLDLFENIESADFYDKSEDDHDKGNNINRHNDRAPASCNNSYKAISKKRKLDSEPKIVNNISHKTIHSFCKWMSDELIAISNNTTIINDTKRELFNIILQAKEKYNKS